MKNNNLEYRMQNIGLKQKLLNPKFYQLPTSKTAGFTLVELIVVIVILAILWTIAFISFQGYSRNSRDSVRIADINSAKKSLEIFVTKTWFYPTPDNGTNITYSWAIVWTEGTLWENVIKNIQSVSKVITDPLTSNEYTYSITSSKTEYQIWAISEWWLANNQTIYNTYAADLSKISAVAYISWNYNEKFTKVNTWTTSWILAQPSIISTDIWNSDLWNILSNKKVVFNNYWNYPHSYNQNSTWWFNYTNWNPIIFTWTLDELHEDNQRKLDFMINLKQAYASTDLATNPIYQDIMSVDTTNDSTWTINLAISYINSNKWGIKLQDLALLPISWTTSWWWTSYTCATQPTYTHASYTAWTPTQPNQARQNTNNTNPCYYTCTDWYIWSDCSVAPNPYTSCTWQNTPTPFSATTTYTWCDTPDIIVCSWNWTWYTVSACNVWATVAWTSTWALTIWKHFQWWRNDWFDYNWWATPTTTTTLYTWTAHVVWWIDLSWNSTYANKFIIASSTYSYNWLSKTWESTDPGWGQWPCESWYHVPTQNEWSWIVTAWQWWSIWSSMQTALKLPYAGYRNQNNGAFWLVGSFGFYWSSAPNDTNGFSLYFYSSGIAPGSSYDRVRGFSLRCFKN